MFLPHVQRPQKEPIPISSYPGPWICLLGTFYTSGITLYVGFGDQLLAHTGCLPAPGFSCLLSAWPSHPTHLCLAQMLAPFTSSAMPSLAILFLTQPPPYNTPFLPLCSSSIAHIITPYIRLALSCKFITTIVPSNTVEAH